MAIPSVCEAAIAHYAGRGLTANVNAGIVAVLYYGESKLQCGPQSGNTGGALAKAAVGIASWNGERQAFLRDFAKKYYPALSVADLLLPAGLNCQLDCVLTEAFDNYPAMKAAIQNPNTTYSDMIETMVNTYEIPADKVAEINRAKEGAAELYAYAVAQAIAPIIPPAPVGRPAPEPAPPAASILDLVALEPMLANPKVQSVLISLIRILIAARV